MAESALHPKNTRSKDFRVAFADTIGVQFNGAQAILNFSIIKDLLHPQEGSEEQVAVGMTIQTMKGLWYTLNAVIANFERASGAEIALSPEFKETIDRLASAGIPAQPSPKKE